MRLKDKNDELADIKKVFM